MEKIRTNALCIFIKNDQVLAEQCLDGKTGEIFYRLFGGGIEFNETSDQTIIREMKEELGVTVTNLNKLTVIENLFEYEGKKGHEITFLYKGDVLEKPLYENKKSARIDKDGYAEWVTINDILTGKVILYPQKSYDYLK